MLTRNTVNDFLQELLDTPENNVLSLYLRVDAGYQPNQNTPRAWQIFVKNALKDVESTADESVAKAIRQQTEMFFENYTPSTKSLILFINPDGVLNSFELPVTMENYAHFGEVDVVPLLWQMDEHERYLVVLVDQEQAQFYSAYLGNMTPNDEYTIDFDDYDFGGKQFIYANHAADGDGLQGSGGEQFDDMKDAHIRRFHKDVAEQIRTVIGEIGSDRVILGGNDKSAHQVRELLHESVREQVVDIVPVPMETEQSQITDTIRQPAINYERSNELDLVNEVIGFAKADGRGALGIDAVRKALEMQQVELLVLSYPMEDEATARELTMMALENGAEIELVHGSAAARLQSDGAVAARLYYAVPQA